MTKVGKSDREVTFAGTRGNDKVAPIPVLDSAEWGVLPTDFCWIPNRREVEADAGEHWSEGLHGPSQPTLPLPRRVRAPARGSAPKIKDPGRLTRSSGGRSSGWSHTPETLGHTDAQVAAIAASIKEWGWTTPALVGEDGGLIAGHARVLAARQLGIAEIPVMVAAGWSEAQKRAYVLADNQLRPDCAKPGRN
jgi:hypothetical protein